MKECTLVRDSKILIDGCQYPKSLGEPPACSPAPAIRSAIYNATGVSLDVAPMTPHVLYRAFKDAGLIQD